MQKFIILTLLSFMLISISHAQHFEMGFTGGYSTFSMKELSADLDEMRKQVPFETEVTDNYPSWISFGGFVMEKWKVYGVGLEYQYNSTGGRISASDYSGRYTFDESLSSNSIGIKNNLTVERFGAFETGFDIGAGFISTSMKVQETFELYGSGREENSISLNSRSLYFQPAIFACFRLPFLKAGFNAGYNIDSKGTLKTSNGQETTMKTDWSGFRLQIFISFIPSGLKKKE